MVPIKIISKFIVLILCSLHLLVFRILIALPFEYMNRVNTTASVLGLEEATEDSLFYKQWNQNSVKINDVDQCYRAN